MPAAWLQNPSRYDLRVTGEDPLNLRQVVTNCEAKAGGIKILAIDGHGGSGKSTLAKLLSTGIGAAVVHTDDFASWDNPKDWWPLLIDRVLDPISNGARSLSHPRSRWWPEHDPPPVVDQTVTNPMILEGVSALRREFRPYVSFGIFVRTPRDVCLERGVARDAAMESVFRRRN
jgi:hypothetical protein